MTSSQVLEETTPENRTRLLHKRALLLSQSPTLESSEPTLEVLVFRVQNERYALDLKDLRSVLRPTGLTRVPSTRPQIAGVLNVRGELVAVLDLASILGLGSIAVGGDSLALLVEVKQGVIGILVDDVLGVQVLLPAQLDASLTEGNSTRGIADGSLAVLDLEELLAERKFGEPEDDS